MRFLASLHELGLFFICFYSTDAFYYGFEPSPFLEKFQFTCKPGTLSRWEVHTTAAELVLTFHCIVIFLNTATDLVVLYWIPDKYDRLKKDAKPTASHKQETKLEFSVVHPQRASFSAQPAKVEGLIGRNTLDAAQKKLTFTKNWES